MPLSRARDYLSIGEVLETVKEDFPDVSISKIRFLESEGLISPERTPSGYRKFYEPDVDRLRYILALQRDQFLPLKVIRERLDEIESNGGGYPQEAAPAPRPAGKPGRNASTASGGVRATGATLNRDELQRAAGLEEDQLKGLVDFGLLGAGSDGSYDENDLLIAKAARGFFEFGVEPRHLRMFRQIADRELGFIEQIVTPVAHRRDPEARREADKSTRELVALARLMHDGILRAGLGPTS